MNQLPDTIPPLLPRDIPGALRWERRPLCINGLDCHAHFIAFDQPTFEPGAFARAAIPLPDTIARSVRTRQAEFFFGRLAAALALQEIGLPDWRVAIGPGREPQFPPAVRGSITHSKTWAAAIALPAHGCRGVGLDIEAPLDAGSVEGVEQLVVDASEQAILRSSVGLPYPVLLALVFSAKESYFKAVYSSVQRILEFSAIKLAAIDLESGRLRFYVPATICADWRQGDTCEIGFGRLTTGEVLTFFAWR
jgi:4'-phosphopantetheinyl transferase EntD